MTESRGYPIRVFWSEEDGAFVAVAPDLPGCSAIGETRHKAEREVQDAIECWLQAARAVGNPIPEPGLVGRSPARS